MSEATSSHGTHPSLLAGLKARDSFAWSQMVDLYAPLIVHWCRQCNLDANRSSDIVQEVFLAVSQKVGQFVWQEVGMAGRGGFRSWLWRVTRNKIIDMKRSTDGEPLGVGGSTARQMLAQAVDPISIPDLEPTNQESLGELMARAIQQVRNEFESKSWQAFWRTAVDGIATSLVALELGMSEGAVRQARSRIQRRLRLQLGDLPQ